MDPLSLVASVTGLILFVKEVKKLSSDLYQTVKKKPQFLRAIAEDLDALQSVLEELEPTYEIPHKGLTQEQNALSKVLLSCNRTLTEINSRLVTLQQMFTKKIVSRLISYKKFDTELKEIVNLRDELGAIKATLSLALHLRAIKYIHQSPTAEGLASLQAELSLLNIRVQRSQDHIQGNVIQQYIDVSSIIVGKTQTSSRDMTSDTMAETAVSSSHSLSSNTDVASSSTTVTSIANQPSEEDIEHVKSFASFDDWLASFSTIHQQPNHSDQPGDTSSPLSPQRIVSAPLRKHSRIQVIVRNLTGPSSSIDPSLPSQEVIELGATDFLHDGIRQLQDRGHKDVCGFRLGDRLFGPLIPCSSPFPLYITDARSGFSPEWLEINVDQVLEQFYDIALRSDSVLKPMRMYKDGTKLTVLDEHDGCSIDISLNRTLRVPEDGTVYNLPALFGPFPLLNVELLQNKLPDLMARKSGLLIPMFVREALSIGFKTGSLRSDRNIFSRSQWHNQSFAIKILAGSVNTISGGAEERLHRGNKSEEKQDYVVVPRQARVDGFFVKAGVNIVRQFVAMPIFSGYTVESQLKGRDEFGGIQLVIAPRFAGRGEFRTKLYGEEPLDQPLDHSQQRLSPRELGLQPGHMLFVSGEGLELRFRNALSSDKDALCTGPEFFIKDPEMGFRIYGRETQKLPYPSTERPALVHELLTMLEEQTSPIGTLVLEPVFRMTITVESRHSSKFSTAKGTMYTGQNPSFLGFQPDYRHDKNPISLTWKISPFMSLQQLFCLVRAEFDTQEIALFRRHEQIEDLEYNALHCILEDGAVISCQAYKPIRNMYQTLGIPSGPIEEVPRVSPWEMGLALGGEIFQDVCIDSQPEWWNWERSQIVNIQILNAVAFKSFTGFEALLPPLSFREYVDAQIPFFQLVSQSQIVGSEVLAKLKTVGEKDLESGINRDCRLTGVTPTGCVICEQNLADTILRPCNHVFCSACIDERMKFRNDIRCSACMETSSHRVTFAAPMEVPKGRDETKEIESHEAIELDQAINDFESQLLEERSTVLVDDLQTALTVGDETEAAGIALSEQSVGLASSPEASYRTTLQIAAEEGRVEIVDFLLRIEPRKAAAPEGLDEISRALELAAAAGHVEVVKSLSSSQLISADFHRGRPLKAAAESGHKDVVAYLLHGTKKVPNTHTKLTTPAIQLAAAKGYHEIVELLVLSGFDPNHAPEGQGPRCQRSTPAQVAAQHGFERVLAVLFRHGADMESDCDGMSYSPLYEAASNGHASAVQYLLSVGASPTRAWRHDCTRTPLRAAAENNHMNVVQLLAGNTTIDDLVCSAVEAAAHDNADIVTWLLSRPCIAAAGSSQALLNAALMKACGEGDGAATTVQYLLDTGADVHRRTHDDAGKTVLHLAAAWKGPGSPAILKLLLDHGADNEALDTSGRPDWYPGERERARSSLRFRPMDTGETALLTAARTGNIAAFEFLLSAGADPLAAAADGRTCLHMATESGVVEMAEQLLDLGLDPNKTCQESGCYSFTTPLSIALAECHFDLTKLLLSRGAVLESGKLLELATRYPKRADRHIEMALFLLPLVDFAAAHRAAPEASPKEGIALHLRELIARAFDNLTLLNGTSIAASASLLQLVLRLCPEPIDDDLISQILEGAALEEDYSLLDAVLQALPEEMSLRVSTDLSNKLGPNPRCTKLAVYLAQRYGGPEAWSGSQEREELEIAHWALPPSRFVSPYSKKDPVDMTSNMLWDSKVKISEKLGIDVQDEDLEAELALF